MSAFLEKLRLNVPHTRVVAFASAFFHIQGKPIKEYSVCRLVYMHMSLTF